MKREYYVKTRGYVINDIEKNYMIVANSQEEAEKIADEQFRLQHIIADDSLEFKVEKRNKVLLVLSVIGLLISVFLAYRNWGVDNRHELFSIAPDLISTFYATILYCSLIVRTKGLELFKSVWDVIIGFLIILVVASLLQVILKTQELTFLGFIPIQLDANYLIVFAIIFSLCGVKIVSLVVFLLMGVLALSNFTSLNAAMGNVFGPMYILSFLCSIGFYIVSDVELKNVVPSFLDFTRNGALFMRSELKAGSKQFERLGNSYKITHGTIEPYSKKGIGE